MKKLLSFVFIAFMFVACGSDTPDVVFKKYLSAYFQGEAKEAAKYVYFKSEDEKNAWIKDLNQYAGMIKTGIARAGGIKSIETFVLKESDNKAEVNCVVTFVSISKGIMPNECKTNLTKINGTWYLDEPFK